jgi:hypothetical protein
LAFRLRSFSENKGVAEMISKYILRALKYVLFAVLFVVAIALVGFVVKGLWNWLMPALFGWKLIGYWQAVGLIILSKILFGGFSGSRGRGGYRRRGMKERWEQRTPEEREQFRQRLHDCWSCMSAPDSKPTA